LTTVNVVVLRGQRFEEEVALLAVHIFSDRCEIAGELTKQLKGEPDLSNRVLQDD
jgi:hypothetical protein